MTNNGTVEELTWNGMYDRRWSTDEISVESFQHPAKFARNLIRAIYRFVFEQGWLHAGDMVLDPFGGVGLGALDAMHMGLNWVGIELEKHFCDIGQGCDCTGISREDWLRFYGRWDRARYLEGRHWCPQCLTQARAVGEQNAQQSFATASTGASYVRNSGRIPSTQAHHYPGNIERWQAQQPTGTATLLHGDSRKLQDVITTVDIAVSSPPYVNSRIAFEDNRLLDGNQPYKRKYMAGNLENYGGAPTNLGNMPEGNFTAVVGSPPFADGGASEVTSVDETPARRQVIGRRRPKRERGYSAVIGSPPFERGAQGGLRKFKNAEEFARQMVQRDGQQGRHGTTLESRLAQIVRDGAKDYGASTGQLGNARGEDFWSASRLIVEQTHRILATNAIAVWVVKDFVRNKQRVEFTKQWQALCEAVGFETLAVVRASLVEDRGVQLALDGQRKQCRTSHKSFFKRVAEKRGLPAIDEEVVLFMRK